MRNNPEISVIVPVYKAEKYLRRCIDSILAQTFSKFEVILVDDGSPDQCGQICDEYAKNDDRIICMHQKNSGVASARNCGIQQAKGKWLCFVDSDDVIHPQMLGILYRIGEQEQAGMCICRTEVGVDIPEQFGVYSDDAKYEMRANTENDMIQYYSCDRFWYWCVWAKLIRREIVLENLFPVGRIYEDNAVVYKWLYSAERVAYVDRAFYFYCTEDTNSITRSMFTIKKTDYLWVLEQQIEFYREHGFDRMLLLIERLLVRAAADHIIHIRKETSGENRKAIHEIQMKIIHLIMDRKSMLFERGYARYFAWIFAPQLMDVGSGIKKLMCQRKNNE
ncbi:MAG: glycosyltransferase family 2 protein [Candidatus Ventricola sp.]